MIRRNFYLGEIIEFYDEKLPLGIGGDGEFFRIISIKEGLNHDPTLILIVHILNNCLEIKVLDPNYIRKISPKRLIMVKALYGAQNEKV